MAEGDRLSEIEPDRTGMLLSQLLRGARSGIDRVGSLISPSTIKAMGDYTPGNLLIGQAPEALADWAHGFGPLKGRGTTTSLDPRAMDVAMLPGVGRVAGSVKGVLKGAATRIPEQSALASMITDLPRGAAVEASHDIPGFLPGTGGKKLVQMMRDTQYPHIAEQSQLATRLKDPKLNERLIQRQREDLVGQIDPEDLRVGEMELAERPVKSPEDQLKNEMFAREQEVINEQRAAQRRQSALDPKGDFDPSGRRVKGVRDMGDVSSDWFYKRLEQARETPEKWNEMLSHHKRKPTESQIENIKGRYGELRNLVAKMESGGHTVWNDYLDTEFSKWLDMKPSLFDQLMKGVE
jgi:hypothetical protein